MGVSKAPTRAGPKFAVAQEKLYIQGAIGLGWPPKNPGVWPTQEQGSVFEVVAVCWADLAGSKVVL